MSVLLEIQNLVVTDCRDQDEIVHNLSFELEEDSCLGIVGESGSGKSIATRALLGLNSKWLKTEGSAVFKEKGSQMDLLQQKESELRCIRGQKICMILQDALSAYDPICKIGKQMCETFIENLEVTKLEAQQMTIEVLNTVNIHNPEEVVEKYPHQLSGGMLQRCMIATALAMKPTIIIADEPTTALDSINQRQVVEAFKKLREKTGTALIFISHDLGVVKYLSDKLLVMQNGKGVEYGVAAEVFSNPKHDYTKYLIQSRLEMTHSFHRAMRREENHDG